MSPTDDISKAFSVINLRSKLLLLYDLVSQDVHMGYVIYTELYIVMLIESSVFLLCSAILNKVL